ncbi:hypothetical protein JJD41_07540 [Oxynema sp. CENA135]|jgi:hypothetical protein|nr:hypothetical protein [Oxynema sp. CENA135]MBK4729721.1 hypothetical protein [Oxynema sp. CENA135]
MQTLDNRTLEFDSPEAIAPRADLGDHRDKSRVNSEQPAASFDRVNR